MNHSISQLRAMIAQTIEQNIAPLTRIDKADILELTVLHLTQLQQRPITMTTQIAYKNGFCECARETARYLSEDLSVSNFTVSCLKKHLQSVFPQSLKQPSHTEPFRTDNVSTPIRPFDHVDNTFMRIGVPECSPFQNFVSPAPVARSSRLPGMNRNGSAFSPYHSSRVHNSSSLNDSNSFSCDKSMPSYNSSDSANSGINSDMASKVKENVFTKVDVPECSPFQNFVSPAPTALSSRLPGMNRNGSAFSPYHSSRVHISGSLNDSNSFSCDKSMPSYNSSDSANSGINSDVASKVKENVFTKVDVPECSPFQNFVSPAPTALGSRLPGMNRNGSAFSPFDSSCVDNSSSLSVSNSLSCDKSMPSFNSSDSANSGTNSDVASKVEENNVGQVTDNSFWRPW